MKGLALFIVMVGAKVLNVNDDLFAWGVWGLFISTIGFFIGLCIWKRASLYATSSGS